MGSYLSVVQVDADREKRISPRAVCLAAKAWGFEVVDDVIVDSNGNQHEPVVPGTIVEYLARRFYAGETFDVFRRLEAVQFLLDAIDSIGESTFGYAPTGWQSNWLKLTTDGRMYWSGTPRVYTFSARAACTALVPAMSAAGVVSPAHLREDAVAKTPEMVALIMGCSQRQTGMEAEQ